MSWQHFSRAIALLLLLVSDSVWAGSARCSVSPVECQRQIRIMLTGRKYLPFQVKSGTKGVGIIVKAVTPDSSAERAGLQPGDRVVALGNKDLSRVKVSELKKILAVEITEPDVEKVVITISRVGTFKRLTVRVERMSKEQVDKVISAHLKSAHSSGNPTERYGYERD